LQRVATDRYRSFDFFQAAMFARHFAACLTASAILAILVKAQQEGQPEGEQCLLQRSRSNVVHAHVGSADSKDQAKSFVGVFGEIDLIGNASSSPHHRQKNAMALSWTTNIGQEFHDCNGSRFKVGYSGTKGGMVVNNGMYMKVGKCAPNGTVPLFTQELTCEANATGCHMWCAPVWQSHHDMEDWGAFDARCQGWDGGFRSEDAACVKMGKIFTWARVDLPEHKNLLQLTYAITKGCTHWCAPLWVTLYDKTNWAKSYRWCINRKDDWGVCDNEQTVSKGAWHDGKFSIAKFMEKHGYLAGQFVLELAVYSEFEDPEVIINSIKLSYVHEVIPTEPPNLAVTVATHAPCGSEPACGDEHQCCRKGNSEVDAKCCPKDWTCCEDSCCPSYYNCTVTDLGHTCKPPVGEVYEVPKLCSLKEA